MGGAVGCDHIGRADPVAVFLNEIPAHLVTTVVGGLGGTGVLRRVVFGCHYHVITGCGAHHIDAGRAGIKVSVPGFFRLFVIRRIARTS